MAISENDTPGVPIDSSNALAPDPWPEGVDCLLMGGIPGGRTEVKPGEAAYPSTATDILKLLGEQHVRAEYAVPRHRRALVAQKAADIWLPILVVGGGIFRPSFGGNRR